jgi:sarcosine oxidase
VAVVGAGVAGAASAWALSRRGLDVVLVEQFGLGHARGGSHGATRIFRLSYAEAEYVRLAQDALAGWRRLEQETDEKLLRFTGLLEVARDVSPFAAALDACGVAWEELDGEGVADRFGIALPEGTTALLQREAGVVYADRSVASLLAASRARGVRVLPDTRVTAIEPVDAGVELVTDGDRLHCDAVVVAAGAWAPVLLDPLGIDLSLAPTAETVVYFRREGAPPSLIDEVDPHAGEAAYALLDPAHGLKAGFHHAGRPVDPDDPGAPDPELVSATVEWARKRYPGIGEPVAVDTCLYANRPGARFFVEGRGRVVVVSACSGHGFKFAPAVGERAADLVLQALGRPGVESGVGSADSAPSPGV